MSSVEISDIPNDKSGNDSANSAVKRRVRPSGTFVKSRYMQATQKPSLVKKNPLSRESPAESVRPSSTKGNRSIRRPATLPKLPQLSALDEPSMLEQSVMQSTFSDGKILRPHLDISHIEVTFEEEDTELNTSKTKVKKEPEMPPETELYLLELETFLLTHLTVMMEHNMAKLKAEAEAKLLQEMEEEEALLKKAQALKCQYLVMEKERQMTEQLRKQNAALAPLMEVASKFTDDYSALAAAVDDIGRKLYLKNIFIGNKDEFLGKVEAQLQKLETSLMDCPAGNYEDNLTCIKYLKDIKDTSKDIGQQMPGFCDKTQELVSLFAESAINKQLSKEEEQLGPERVKELYGFDP